MIMIMIIIIIIILIIIMIRTIMIMIIMKILMIIKAPWPGPSGPWGGSVYQRTCAVGRFRDRATGATLVAFSAHFDHAGGEY